MSMVHTVSGKSRRKFPLVNIDQRWFGGEDRGLKSCVLLWVWGRTGERGGVCVCVCVCVCPQ